MLYNVVLVSAVQEHESVICIHLALPSTASLPTPTHPFILTDPGAELPVLYSSFLPATYFTWGSVYMSKLLSRFVPPSPSPAGSTSPFSVLVSLFLLCKQVHQYHFSRFHMYVNTYFSLSDL